MKNNFLKKLLWVVSIVLVLSTACKTNTMAEPVEEYNEKPKLIFPVISDVHIGADYSEDKFKNMMNDFNNVVTRYDAMAVVGDLTNAGHEWQYDNFMKIFNSYKSTGAEGVIAIGNHEYYAGDSNNAGYERRFVKKTGMPAPYYDKWIKGYHFIVLSPEDKETANISDNQLKWLNEKLNEKRDEHRPIFVLFHHPFSNTVYGSELWGWVDKNERIYGLLKRYPEAILFTGHTHYTPENPKAVYEKEFTMVNTSSVYYTIQDDNNKAPFNLTHGVIVKVYDERVEISYREAFNHKWVGETYNIEY